MAGVNAKEYAGVWCNVSNGGHKRIVGIQAKLGILSFSDGSFQFIQSMCHLTVTIQLVAEDIGENNDFWRNVVQHELQGGFIALNYRSRFLRDTIPFCI